MISLSILAVVVFIHVFRKGPITIQRVQGAVAGYLLLGLIWVSAYELLELFVPGAIRNSNQAIPPETMTPNFIYFSFTTLTTVGYGDLTPVHHVARSSSHDGGSNRAALSGDLDRAFSIDGTAIFQQETPI